jgi:hypothetical protein
MPNDADRPHDPDQDADPRELWRWVGAAVRPWLGWILIAAGALLMLLGYFGVSREAQPGKQIPYLVSGGVGGMFLAVLGAYFLGTQELRRDSGRLDRIEKQIEELHRALLERTDAPTQELHAAESTSAAGSNGHAADTSVVMVESGESYHRSGCALATGKSVTGLTPAAAERRGLRPCPVCEPVVTA